MLATYASKDGTSIYPGVARLAVDTELNYRTVQRGLAKLRNAGLIEITRRGAPRAGRADTYRLVPVGTREVTCDVLTVPQRALMTNRIAEAERGSGTWRRQRFARQGSPAKATVHDAGLHDTSDVQNPVCTTVDTVLHDSGYPPPSIDPEVKEDPPAEDPSRRTPRTGGEVAGGGNQDRIDEDGFPGLPEASDPPPSPERQRMLADLRAELAAPRTASPNGSHRQAPADITPEPLPVDMHDAAPVLHDTPEPVPAVSPTVNAPTRNPHRSKGTRAQRHGKGHRP